MSFKYGNALNESVNVLLRRPSSMRRNRRLCRISSKVSNHNIYQSQWKMKFTQCIVKSPKAKKRRKFRRSYTNQGSQPPRTKACQLVHCLNLQCFRHFRYLNNLKASVVYISKLRSPIWFAMATSPFLVTWADNKIT